MQQFSGKDKAETAAIGVASFDKLCAEFEGTESTQVSTNGQPVAKHSYQNILEDGKLVQTGVVSTAMSANEQQQGASLTRDQILAAFRALSDELGAKNIKGEICLFGGTVMVLAFTARLATKDVDAVFQPAQTIRELALRVADQQHLPADWLNDGVKGFVSARHQTTAGNLPQFPNLRLTMPVPEYLLAMKCMAARISGTKDEPSDVADIAFLVRHLQLKSAKETLDLVGQYYPASRIPVKTQYLVEGLFAEGKI